MHPNALPLLPQARSPSQQLPATELQTSINQIEHRLRIVRRIATRKAAEQQPEANAIGQGRLQSRLAKQFNDQIEQQLVQGWRKSQWTNALNQERVELKR